MTIASMTRNWGIENIIGTSDWARGVRAYIARVAAHDSTVLINGPTGTGKELIARALHAHSPRSSRPLIPVDCTAISGTLFASQLFGHRKGAYTGAQYEALGCFRAADRGTIFLDEIGEMDPELQAKLLRVIQEKMVIPVGSHEGVPVDVRIVSATNRDLKKEVVAGRFREDLYYRLAVVPIQSVPLKERADDIPVLAEHFLTSLQNEFGFPRKQLSPGALELLRQFEWPGNVRQLRHMLEQTVVACDGPLITLALVQHVLREATMPDEEPLAGHPPASEPPPAHDGRPTYQHPYGAPAYPQGAPQYPYGAPGTPPRYGAPPVQEPWDTLQELERKHILITLEHVSYNQSAAARMLGVTRQALVRKMQKYKLTMPTGIVKNVPRLNWQYRP